VIRRARVIRQKDAGQAVPRALPALELTEQPAPLRPRIIARPIADAKAEARALLEKARDEAQQIISRAEAAANDLILQQHTRARADALCLVVGEALELRKRQAELEKSVLDRSVDFATLLAERLLGEELSLAPERVRALARQALTEAAGARHAIIVAHPRDACELRSGLVNLGSLLESIGIEDDPKLTRGHIRVETELGVIEADVRGQLERLAAQLRKLLTSHAPDGP
jgi:flagellar biosynthesis/type III secretory pathway protein FliH